MRDLAATIQSKLKTKARSLGVAPNAVYSYWAMERFLNRLSRTSHRRGFVLKGAMLFAAWEGNWRRSTADVDLESLDDLWRGRIAEMVSVAAIEDPTEPDGIEFLPETLRVQPLTNDPLTGDRVVLQARLGATVLHLKVDTGFGHPITPWPEPLEYPSMLDGYSATRILGCPRETMLADKLATIVEFGRDNTRARDYYDIWVLARHCTFDSASLLTAIQATFAHRGADRLLNRHDGYWEAGLSSDFARGRIGAAWRNWSQRLPQNAGAPSHMETLVKMVGDFAVPLLVAAREGKRSIGRWNPKRGWGDHKDGDEIGAGRSRPPRRRGRSR